MLKAKGGYYANNFLQPKKVQEFDIEVIKEVPRMVKKAEGKLPREFNGKLDYSSVAEMTYECAVKFLNGESYLLNTFQKGLLQEIFPYTGDESLRTEDTCMSQEEASIVKSIVIELVKENTK